MLKRQDSGCNSYLSTLEPHRQRCDVQTEVQDGIRIIFNNYIFYH